MAAQKSGAFSRRFDPVFSAEIMAKPDPIPTFIEVGALAKPLVPAVGEQDKPVQMDWVDEF
ncbi:MAG: hypothetical protein WBC73_19855, partial [Phormidesmis sp.]